MDSFHDRTLTCRFQVDEGSNLDENLKAVHKARRKFMRDVSRLTVLLD